MPQPDRYKIASPCGRPVAAQAHRPDGLEMHAHLTSLAWPALLALAAATIGKYTLSDTSASTADQALVAGTPVNDAVTNLIFNDVVGCLASSEPARSATCCAQPMQSQPRAPWPVKGTRNATAAVHQRSPHPRLLLPAEARLQRRAGRVQQDVRPPGQLQVAGRPACCRGVLHQHGASPGRPMWQFWLRSSLRP